MDEPGEIHHDQPHPPPHRPTEPHSKPRYRSWRKKYVKRRQKFNSVMAINMALHLEVQKMERIAKRLREENNQLMEVMLDLNNSTIIPSSLHYDIDSAPPSPSAVPELDPPYPTASYRDQREANSGIVSQTHKEPDGGESEPYVTRATTSRDQPVSLHTLSATVPHCRLNTINPKDLPFEMTEETPVNYLTTEQETEHLAFVDTLGDEEIMTRGLLVLKQPLKERDTTVNNPVSVQNWLHAHSRELAVSEEKEPGVEKAGARGGGGASTGTGTGIAKGSKRGSLAKVAVEDVYDEDGVLISGIPELGGAKGKRKREDEAYRPKGGGRGSSKRPKIVPKKDLSADG